MGSSIEASITISCVILIIVSFVLFPARIFTDSYYQIISEMESLYSDSEGIRVDNFTQEHFNTFLIGISENYRLIYGGIEDVIEGN